MRILFIAPSYMGLSLPIRQIMEDLGNSVYFMEDITPPFYPYFRREGLQRILYNIMYSFRNIDKKYIKFWDELIDKHNLLEKKFDLLFCINGTSLHPYFFNKITEVNPKIRKVLYIWDTNKYYNFEWYLKYFEKAYTFDQFDAINLNIKYLPFYYVMNDNVEEVASFDAFCIGSLHDGRLSILDKIASQMDNMNLNYLFRVVYRPIKNTLKNRVIYFIKKLIDNPDAIIEREYKMGLRKHRFLTTESVPVEDYNKLMAKSKVIIDTDRQSQAGLTPRLVWAIASGKSVVTTNSCILESKYCPKDRVWVIDRERPIIKPAMFKEYQSNDDLDLNISQLEIKHWITNFLE